MSKFRGPLFVVGMPRSGTKLLRDLLNQHPEIYIPTSESHFIPHFFHLFGSPPDLSSKAVRDQFYDELTKRNFFTQMERQGLVLTRESIDEIPDKTSWDSIFSTIFKFYAATDKENPIIWGDKTPSYINCTLLLKRGFGNARFIHIVRDPRDCSLSVRNAWSKNIFRAAHQWRKGIEKINEDAQALGSDYMEITYEDLLSHPVQALSRICHFLDIEFTPSMTKLGRATENLGSAKGKLDIVGTNQNKYLTELAPRQVKRIEEIVYPAIRFTNYSLENFVGYNPLSTFELKILAVRDGLTSLAFHIKERGIINGIRYFYDFHGRNPVNMFYSILRRRLNLRIKL